jgi:hypothetical protein
MEEMETQVLGSKLGKVGGSLTIDTICNQALEGGNESDCVVTSSKRCKTRQVHPCVSKRRTKTIVQSQVELEPRSCTQESFVVNNIEPIHFGDDTQMDQSDGEAQMVSNKTMILAPTPLTKGVNKETIVHTSSPQ